ncbi:oppC protein [Lapidilactobacillus concavus DSM 17758]|uniref:OppC protein n=1 Tax=Lapidilactobacillus concavus DSM 17758 TaxID=1423735 RepID=A0A0R1W196_9LACO|nr:ABC transporter permease [Lapidilactobacillus concavus]KRM08076.1 oppC protein [Lapidilactobacillus concavus DSM 17758]GEL12956.1 peptide ABC transporter permease [Lapidilactobacillus concavus]
MSEQADKLELTPDSFKRVGANDTDAQEKISAPSLTFFQDAIRRLKQNKAAIISFWLLAIIILISIVSIWWTPSDPNAQHVAYANLPPKIGNGIPGFTGQANVGGQLVDKYAQANVPKGTYYILGTDYLGRDLFSRLMKGIALSLLIGMLATLFDLMIGVPYGIISGWRGGHTDTIMQRIIEIISSIPNLVVVILMLLLFTPGLGSIVVAMGITGWITMARLIRAETLTLKTQEYVLAARTIGESPFKIATKHLIPNLSSTIIIQTMFSIPTAIFFEAFLSFIGIGIPAPNASLGTLLSDGQKTFRFLPYQMWYPAAAISIIMIAFNLLADGLRDAFDPKTNN